jgi:glutamine amidotransferase
LKGAWLEVPESSYLTIAGGEQEIRPFAPVPPARASAVA